MFDNLKYRKLNILRDRSSRLFIAFHFINITQTIQCLKRRVVTSFGFGWYHKWSDLNYTVYVPQIHCLVSMVLHSILNLLGWCIFDYTCDKWLCIFPRSIQRLWQIGALGLWKKFSCNSSMSQFAFVGPILLQMSEHLIEVIVIAMERIKSF